MAALSATSSWLNASSSRIRFAFEDRRSRRFRSSTSQGGSDTAVEYDTQQSYDNGVTLWRYPSLFLRRGVT